MSVEIYCIYCYNHFHVLLIFFGNILIKYKFW